MQRKSAGILLILFDHVESIVLLSHKSPGSVINVKVEFGEGDGKVPLDAIADRAKKYQPSPKITYKIIQEYVKKKYGFKVYTAYIAEVKIEDVLNGDSTVTLEYIDC